MQLTRLIEIESQVPSASQGARIAASLFDAPCVEPQSPDWPGSATKRFVLGETVIALRDTRSPVGALRPAAHTLSFAIEGEVSEAAQEARRLGIEVLELQPTPQAGPAPRVVVLATQHQLGFAVALVGGLADTTPAALFSGFQPTTTLSPIFQVEPVVPSADAAVALVEELFGGRVVEEEFSAKLQTIAPSQRIRHVLLGDTVVQLIEMQAELPNFSWSDLQREHGAAIHNLTFMVREMSATKESLSEAGIDVILAADLPWSDLIGADKAISGGEPFCIAATREAFGFHLELCVPFTDRVIGLLHRPVWGIG